MRAGVSVDFVAVANVADVAPGSAATVVVDGREIALFNIDGTFYAWCFRLEDGSMTRFRDIAVFRDLAASLL